MRQPSLCGTGAVWREGIQRSKGWCVGRWPFTSNLWHCIKSSLNEYHIFRIHIILLLYQDGHTYQLCHWWPKFKLDLTHSERRPQNYLFLRGKTYILSSNWQHKFLYFHYKSVKLDVLCRQNKIWTFGHPFWSKKLLIFTQNTDL